MYKGNPTKYGNRTTSQIAVLTNMSIGDTVFNTDYGMVEIYTGSVWTNTCSIIATSGSALSEGKIVYLNSSGQVVPLNTSTINVRKAVGVVQYGALAAGSSVVIRTHGLAKCHTSAAVTIGSYAATSSTAGSIGDTTSPTTGTMGRILQTVGTNSLCYVALTFIEKG